MTRPAVQWILWSLFAAVVAIGCEPAPQSMFPADGPGAARIADLWWIFFWATLVPAVAVIGLTLYLVLRRRPLGPVGREGEADRRLIGDDLFIAGGGVFLPVVIVAILLVANVRIGNEIAHPPGGDPDLTVDIIGHKFWWEIRYPEHGIVTANEVRIPTGEPVRLRLASADVIHSFWVPRLHGKIDTVPGKVNTFWIQADRPGAYRGQCAEFCGVQHALMGLLLIATERADFDDWIARHRRPAPLPEEGAARRGLEVYLAAGCAVCHQVRGHTPSTAGSSAGPDLTHLAGRRTLGAALVPNNRDNLGGWIVNPHALKPGVRMPATTLPADELHDLLTYLEGLR